MALPNAPAETKNGEVRTDPVSMNTAVTAFSIMNVHSWSDHALSLTNSVAGIIALIAAAVLIVSLGLLYVSGNALTARVMAPVEGPRPELAKASEPAPARNGSNGDKASAEEQRRVASLTKELTEARLSAEARRADMARLQRDLAEAQKSDKAKTERVARLENDFETVKRSEQEKSSRVAQLEEELARIKQSDAERASRIARIEKDLEAARQTSAQKEKDLEAARKTSAEPAAPAEGPVVITRAPRAITPAQREQFLHSVQGKPTGKVIISAFFENKETHDFGRSLIALLNAAGFQAIEQAPVNFFTTSRPSSGIRIGCENMSHPPRHFVTLRQGIEAMGMEIPDASVVNAQEADVVEIQITPKE